MISAPLFAAALASAPTAPAPPVVANAAGEAMAELPDAGTASNTEIIIGTPDRYDRMTVPVTVEGEGPFRFMIDTGSQATVVTRGLSERLQLETVGTATVVGMASRVPVQLVELNGLEFAARVLDNITAPLLEAHHIGADGILGLDSLQDLRVMINFRDETIAVDNAKELGGNRGYEIVVRARRKLGRLIITDAVIDGVSTAVIIDTGAQGSIGNMALRRRLRGSDQGPSTATDVNGSAIKGNVAIAKSLRIQSVQLSNTAITFADSPAFDELGLGRRPALILGMNDLRGFDRVAIDFNSRQVLFDLPPQSYRGATPVRSTKATRLYSQAAQGG
ncbi:aspartyl protease family protein [Allopontixanthobacter sp.]|uniref:aspartyl protease family protein n=1 Tax=Allopontixanthobacter sp. TaxID=2906452 RepID=UPI002ABC4F8F|nr:aspartyl protease family protein [Allopontixanthobacter sp.]MDZ4306701.1 aspartyl protease family protein [Allopontixanthobacter sp.]